MRSSSSRLLFSLSSRRLFSSQSQQQVVATTASGSPVLVSETLAKESHSAATGERDDGSGATEDFAEWNGRVQAIVSKVNRATKGEAKALHEHLEALLADRRHLSGGGGGGGSSSIHGGRDGGGGDATYNGHINGHGSPERQWPPPTKAHAFV